MLDSKVLRPVLSPFALLELGAGVRSRRVLPWGRSAETEVEVASCLGEIYEALKLCRIRTAPITCETLVGLAS